MLEFQSNIEGYKQRSSLCACVCGVPMMDMNASSRHTNHLLEFYIFSNLQFFSPFYIYFNYFQRKLHFITQNYALDYTLHHKLSNCALCSLNHHTLYPGVIFSITFNRILVHVTITCFLLRWNKVKRLKHHSSKSIKTKPNFFLISLPLSCLQPLPQIYIFINPKSPIRQLLWLHHCSTVHFFSSYFSPSLHFFSLNFCIQ